MKNKKAELELTRESNFIQFETRRICKQRNKTMKFDALLLIAGLLLFFYGYQIRTQQNKSIYLIISFSFIITGVLLFIRMLLLRKHHIAMKLWSQFNVDGLGLMEFDEEMEQYGACSLDWSIIVTRHFIIQRERFKTVALCLDDVYFITGALEDRKKKSDNIMYMRYNGHDMDEEGIEEFRSNEECFFIEFYNENGEVITNQNNHRAIINTKKESITREILRDIHASHPWIYMGREQWHCMNDDYSQEYKLLFDENKTRYLKMV